MMLFFIYASGWCYIFYSGKVIFSGKKFNYFEKLLLFIISLVPLGKLVYFNIPLLGGLKFSFSLLMISLGLIVIGPIFNKNFKFTKSSLSLLCLFIPAIFSILFLESPEMLVFYRVNDEQSDSVIFRLVSFLGLLLFAAWISDFVKKNGFYILFDIFCKSLLFATFIGYVIYYMVMTMGIGEAELNPISAGVHVAEGFYRFNPGANVNEFGVILAYGLFLVMWMPWTSFKKTLYLIPFLGAEFLSLTRGAWVALIVGLIAHVFLMFRGKSSDKKSVIRILFLVVIAALCLSVAAYLSSDLASLLESRSSLQGGASGDERIEKFQSAFNSVISSPIRFLFGFGWATNLYAHSLPVQIGYEVGLLGMLFYVIAPVLLLYKYSNRQSNRDTKLCSVLLIVALVASLFHHTIYHMQTWFVIGLAWGIYTKKYNCPVLSHPPVPTSNRIGD